MDRGKKEADMRGLWQSSALVLLAAAPPANAQFSQYGSDMRTLFDNSGLPPSSRTILREALVQGREPISDPREVARLAGLMSEMLTEGRRDELSRLSLEAVRAGRRETIGEPLATSLAVNAVDAAMTEAPDIIPDLLASIDNPPTLVRYLAQRRYQAIWPQVEARVGQHQGTVHVDWVTHERERLAASPDDTMMVLRLALALFADSHYAASADHVRDWRHQHPGVEIDESLAWAINQQALALWRLGRVDEADAAMAEIAGLPNGAHGRRAWVVNFAINRAELLAASGRYEAALTAARRARQMRGTDYARLLIARIRACSLEQLGRHDEAMRELPTLRENLALSIPYAGSGMLCLGQREVLVAELRRLLVDEEVATDNFALLQTGRDAEPEDLPLRPSVNELIASEPSLRVLLEQWSRPIPEAYRLPG